MKRLLLLLLTTGVLIYIPIVSFAGPQEDYEQAYKIYLAAGASAAAYHDRLGDLANHYMEQDGWQIDHYIQMQGHTGARYLIARKKGIPYYIVAIVGTENKRDVKTDLKVGKVYFAGSNAEEFAANAAKEDVPDMEPKVHRGFNEFIQAGPSAVLQNSQHTPISLINILTADKSCKLYLTGHSLGGAAATLAGARLLSIGINPNQLEVITFGAPAVGNAAFATKFGSTLPLTRVVNSGDPVTGVLQTLVGGYQQFGQEVKWYQPDTIEDAHQLTGYIDAALKNYFDKRRQAIEAGMVLPTPTIAQQAAHGRVYIVPLQNHLPSDLATEFWYMQEALQDEYRQTLPDYVTADSQTVPATWQERAAASGCRWAILSEVSAMRVKREKSTYYITVTQIVYDVATGTAIDTATFSTGTYNLTLLEAFIHACRDINTHQNSWLMTNDTVNEKNTKQLVF